MCVGNAILISEISAKKAKGMCDQINCTKTDNKKSATTQANENVVREDTLAVFTYYTKVVLFSCGDTFKKSQNSKWYKILTRTTQPAHLITLLAVSVIACLMYPNSKEERANKSSPLLNLLYLGSVSAHFGAQLWMSFVSGLSLYFCLPRHTFGKVQRILFPKYFLINAIMSLISLSVFLINNNTKLDLPQVSMQIGTLTTCFLIELVVRLYLTPPLLKLMEKTNAFEETAGVGMEIGRHNAGSLSNNQQYLKVYKSFRKLHMVIAMGNIITMGCSVLHLHYLSHKLHLL